MLEYTTWAVALVKEPRREQDASVGLFTQKCGLVLARAAGMGKITSRLSAHLEPGTLSIVRIVEGRGVWMADALKQGKAPATLRELLTIRHLAAVWQADGEVWRRLLAGNQTIKGWLKHFGFDGRFANCQVCGQGRAELFNLEEQEWRCRECQITFKTATNHLILEVD